MPTGYTSCIGDGATFEKFVLGCARAFGACVTMRDDDADAPIPKEFKPTTYHQKEIIKLKKEIQQIKNMPHGECSVAALKEFNEEVYEQMRYIQKYNKLREKYNSMLDKVYTWKCPVSHNEFKDFMIRQITESIDFDCKNGYVQEELNTLLKKGPQSGLVWKLAKLKELNHDVQYNIDEDKKEIERVAGRNKWLKILRESLNEGGDGRATG